MESILKSKWFEVLLGVVVLVVLVAAGYFIWVNYARPVATLPTPTPLTKEEASKADLGSQLYEKSQNPISDKLPDTVTTVPNPIQDIYKNPFQ